MNDEIKSTQTEGKTFTQDDVNRIVQDRLAKEKAKNADSSALDEREKDLARREMNLTSRELLTSKNLPCELIDALNCTDKETLEKSVDILEKYTGNIKMNALSNIKFKGLEPGNGEELPDIGDSQIRKAMGLSS